MVLLKTGLSNKGYEQATTIVGMEGFSRSSKGRRAR